MADHSHLDDPTCSPLGSGPLVPLLRPDDDPADPVTRRTWHEAISASVLPEIPHELFGLWLYPRSGGAVLLGPEDLAADHLSVPAPPNVSPEQLRLLEEIVQAAGYRSVTAVTASTEGEDVGLLLLAALAEGVHSARERAAAQLTADALAPSLARLARRWRADGEPRPERTASDALSVTAAASLAATQATSPRDLAERLSAAFADSLPHDRFELMAPGASLEQWYRLGAQQGGALWGDPDLVISRDQVDLAALLGTADSFLLSGLPGEPVAFPPVAGAPAMRSVLGVRLAVGSRTVGLVMLGGRADAQYLEEDVALVADSTRAAAARLDAFVMAGHLSTLRTHVAEERGRPARLARVLETLATTDSARDAMEQVQSEAAALLAFDELRIALRLGDESRVAVFTPGERRALPDLPQMPLGESPLADVVRGTHRVALADGPGFTELIVPLRVQGTTIGALVFVALQEGMFGGPDEETARQLADALAPHLELLRRAALGGAMMLPGWKRAPRTY